MISCCCSICEMVSVVKENSCCDLKKMNLRGSKVATAFLLMILIPSMNCSLKRCHITEYKVGHGCCPVCPTGSQVKTDCTEFTETSCLPCADGTYMETPTGKKHCNPCKRCDEGFGLRLKYKCSPSSDTVCEALEGYFCTDVIKGSCAAAKKHSSCKPGQYISKEGTSLSDTECSECSRGTFSNGSLTLCQPHTQCEELNLQLVKEGTNSTDAKCGGKNINVAGGVEIPAVLVVCVGIAVAFYVVWKKEYIKCGKQRNTENGEDSTDHRKGPTLPPENLPLAAGDVEGNGESVKSPGTEEEKQESRSNSNS